MFTGLVEATGVVEELISVADGSARISVRTGLEGIRAGESVAINGVCLTVRPGSGMLEADVSRETIRRTALEDLQPGTIVNLERALPLGGRLGGHLVQGHVDTTGVLTSTRREGSFAVMHWNMDGHFADLLIDKGSVAVDGISLTVVDPDGWSFSAAIIPETIARTNLSQVREGDRVNLEFDMIAKYVKRLVRPYIEQ